MSGSELAVIKPEVLKAYIWLQCFDGSIQQVEEKVAMFCPMIYQEIVKNGTGSSKNHAIDLPERVNPANLSLILDYCRFHQVPGRSNKEQKLFDEEFVQIDYEKLCKLASAALSLQLRPLVDLTCGSPAPRHSCAKLSVAVEDPKAAGAVFVKATWLPTRFSLAVTDGAGAWVADASDAEVRLRAEQWDQPVDEYLNLAERYLAFQQPTSTYSFHDAGNGSRRLSWTFEKLGTRLEWRWKLQPSPNAQQTISGILDFLMDANIRLSEEVVRKTQSFDKLKQEAEKCLEQSERFNKEKAEFEEATFTKFVAVLNSKKAKLRQLRDKIAQLEPVDKPPKEEEEEEEGEGGNSTDRTELYEEGSDKEASVNAEPSETGSGDHHSSPEKTGATSRGTRGRKRTRK